MDNIRCRIVAAWYVPAGAITQWNDKGQIISLQHGRVLARDLNDRIYTLKTQEFADPRALLKRINAKGIINLSHWTLTADDSPAVRYFDDRQFD